MAGGQARRFDGAPKGLAIVDEERIADRVLAALRGATDRQFVVSNHPEADDWFPKLRVVSDDTPGLGPLAGIETALRAAKGSSIIVVAWDMPFVSTPLLRGMRAVGETGAPAVVPVHGSPPVVEALCAFYSAEALAVCSELLVRGERRAAALVDALPAAVRIPERVLAEHGEIGRLFLSVDTPEALAAIGGIPPRR